MPHSRPLQTIRKQLQEQLVDDLAAALKSLQTLLPENSEKHLLVLSLLGRLHDVNKSRLRNTLSNDDLQREYDRIRADLLDLVQGLEEIDFDPAEGSASAASARAAAAKQGSVLYRIPHVMPLEKETRCVVRIALNEDAIVENISLDEHVQLKSLYRVSDTMQAEITDPSGGRVFHIRSTSEPIQIIDKQGYTEWRFYVTPHVEGAHPLEVKVSIIEMKDGQPQRKELVLEETVEVVAESPVPDDAEEPMKKAGYAFAFQTSAPMLVSYEMTPSPARFDNWQRKAVLFLAFLVLGTAAGLAYPWVVTRYIENTPKAYHEFIKNHPNSVFRKKAVEILNQLETKAFDEIHGNMDALSIRSLLGNFPYSPRLEEVKQIVETREDLKQEFLPVILRLIEQRDRKTETPQRIDPSGPPTTESENPPVSQQEEGLSNTTKPSESPGASGVPASPVSDVETETVPSISPEEKKEPEKTDPIPPSISSGKAIKPDMVFVKGGVFKMGSENGEKNEKPVHEVTLSDFYIGKYEVTFDEYDRFCEATGRKKNDDRDWGRGKRPVINVSWYDAVAYCNWLSEQEGLAPAYTISRGAVALLPKAKGYRLPTEAEWEYAARGGDKSRGYEYSGGNELGDVAWYSENSIYKTQQVGDKKENELKLHDMSGNVWEWCGDYYSIYSSGSFDNPTGPVKGSFHVYRGGSWFHKAQYCRATYRFLDPRDHKGKFVGFRLASSPQ